MNEKNDNVILKKMLNKPLGITIYILYKQPVQLDTLYIVQYLYYLGINLQPNTIIERNHPAHIINLPSIECNGKLYSGLDECISFYETYSNIQNVLVLSREFKRQNPKYTIK